MRLTSQVAASAVPASASVDYSESTNTMKEHTARQTGRRNAIEEACASDTIGTISGTDCRDSQPVHRRSVPEVGSRKEGDLLCRGEFLKHFVDVEILRYR
jgi:hypothetical protein